jgi:uncharacterized protein RhaS with RHS repeats
MRARYYNPHLKRFINADPIGFASGSNWYTYAANSPLLFIDPSGLCQKTADGSSWWDSAWIRTKGFGIGVLGLLEASVGGVLVVGGTGATGTGAGAPVGIPSIAVGSGMVVHGTSTAAGGFYQLWTGRETDSLISQGLQAAGASQNTANLIDAGAGLALGGGAMAVAAKSTNLIKSAAAVEKTVSAATPVGRLGAPLGTVVRNTPTTINGRVYTGHALDQMQARGLVPSVVEAAIAQGARSAGRDGATIFTTNQARVILNPNGSVKTVMPQ